MRIVSEDTLAAINSDPDFFKLEHLVVNWSNLCNLTCVYCNPQTSTAWQSVKKIPINHVKNEHEDLIELVKTQGHNIQGLYRDPRTLAAVEYYCKLPEDIADREAIVLDPMLATGHSAAAAVTRTKELGAKSVRYVCLLAAPEGVKEMNDAHPDVPIITAAVDSHLNDHGYIVPGLGDAGDRLYGTK